MKIPCRGGVLNLIPFGILVNSQILKGSHAQSYNVGQFTQQRKPRWVDGQRGRDGTDTVRGHDVATTVHHGNHRLLRKGCTAGPSIARGCDFDQRGWVPVCHVKGRTGEWFGEWFGE